METNSKPAISDYLDLTENATMRSADVLQKTVEVFLDGADARHVYGAPIREGDRVIIPAAEIMAGMSFGYGTGRGPQSADGKTAPGGTGGGGVGKTFTRPVAVIIAEPDGVRIKPVFDPTKIILAAITAFGFMASTLLRIKRGK